MNTFVWIFGPSAVGKKTAMLDAANLNQVSVLREFLGLDLLTPIVPLVLPSTIIGEDEAGCARRVHQRISWLDMFYRLRDCDHPAVMLVHGQRIDITHGVLDRLKAAYPDRFGLALYVEVDRATFDERNAKRGYDVDYATIYRNHRLHQRRLRQLFKEVKTIQL